MTKKYLNILTQSHRVSLEEQVDPALWLSAVLYDKGYDLSLLLRGGALGSAVLGQDAGGLSFGDLKQTQPPELEEDIKRLISKGVSIHYISEEAESRGFNKEELVEGLKPISRKELPEYFESFDQIWSF